MVHAPDEPHPEALLCGRLPEGGGELAVHWRAHQNVAEVVGQLEVAPLIRLGLDLPEGRIPLVSKAGQQELSEYALTTSPEDRSLKWLGLGTSYSGCSRRFFSRGAARQPHHDRIHHTRTRH